MSHFCRYLETLCAVKWAGSLNFFIFSVKGKSKLFASCNVDVLYVQSLSVQYSKFQY